MYYRALLLKLFDEAYDENDGEFSPMTIFLIIIFKLNFCCKDNMDKKLLINRNFFRIESVCEGISH